MSRVLDHLDRWAEAAKSALIIAACTAGASVLIMWALGTIAGLFSGEGR